MTARPPQIDDTAAESLPSSESRFFNLRQRRGLKRSGALALFLLLAFFWWATVYTFLLTGWTYLNGIDLVEGSGFTWNGRSDWALMILALLSLLPFQQRLRTRIAHFVDATDDPYSVISRLSEDMDAAQADASPMAAVASLLAKSINAPYVSIEAEHETLSAIYGEPTVAKPISMPLRYNHLSLGELHIGPRLVAGLPIRMDERLLRDLAWHVSVTLYAAQVSADLQESRRRIVTAREEARRQLRRDLHDGLGPSLAAMTMQADTARELMYDDPELAEQLLAKFVVQTQAMVTEIRRIVHGLRPPALDDVGLYGALELLVNSFTSSALQTAIRLPPTRPTLSAALEVAIYRILQEALTNISRHAHAQTAVVVLKADKRQLTLSICDDGVGLPDQPEMGMGLESMRERAEELGGALTIQQNNPAGSCIFAQFPLEPGESNGPDSHPDL